MTRGVTKAKNQNRFARTRPISTRSFNFPWLIDESANQPCEPALRTLANARHHWLSRFAHRSAHLLRSAKVVRTANQPVGQATTGFEASAHGSAAIRTAYSEIKQIKRSLG